MANTIEEQVREDIKNILLAWGLDTCNKMKIILQSKNKIASKVLYNSIKPIVGDDLKLIIQMASYARYVDSGRAPGKYPNLSAILKWMNIKGIDKKFSFAIMNKIKRDGIKPTNFTEPFSDSANRELLEKMLLDKLGVDILEYFKDEVDLLKF